MLSSTSVPNAYLHIKKNALGSSSGYVYTDLIFKKSATTSLSTYSITFPNKSGTLALTSEIPSLYSHNITIYSAHFCYLTFQFINTNSYKYQSYSSLASALDKLGATYDTSVHCGVPCSGIYRGSSAAIISVPYAVHSNENMNGIVVCFGATISASTVGLLTTPSTATISSTTYYQIVDLVKELA